MNVCLSALTVVLLAAGVANAQDKWIDNSVVTIRPSANGSLAKISLKFKPGKCGSLFWTYPPSNYEVEICDMWSLPRNCFIEKVKTTKKSEDQKYEVNKHVEFWANYTLEVRGKCLVVWDDITDGRVFYTGPGEMATLESVEVTPRDHSAVVGWQERRIGPKPASHVAIDLCTETQENCTEIAIVEKDEEEYEITDLIPGVEYIVRARLQVEVEGRKYISQPISRPLKCNPPTPDQYPPVSNVQASVAGKRNTADVKISFSKPATIPAGKELVGFTASLSDMFDSAVGQTVTVANNESQASFVDVPLFSHLSGRVDAIYALQGHRVHSQPALVNFSTGPGELARPVITKLTAVSDTKALVEWSHLPKESAELAYTICWGSGDNSTKEMPDARETTALIEGLMPGSQYQFTITSHVSAQNQTYSNTSDPVLVTMMPHGALRPTDLSHLEVTALGVELQWQLTLLQNASSHCRQLVTLAAPGRNTTTYDALPIWTRNMLLPFYPFENNSYVVATECHYGEVTVGEESEPHVVFGAFAPSPPRILQAVARLESRIHLSFRPWNAKEGLHVAGFVVRWKAAADAGNWTGEERTDRRGVLNIHDLTPGTEYNISVAAFTSHSDGDILGRPAFVQVQTGIPVPPPVSNLHAVHTPFTSKVVVSWTPPDYKHEQLEFAVNIVCRPFEKFTFHTTASHILVDVQTRNLQECNVRVFARTETPPGKRSNNQDTSFTFIGIEAPRRVRVTKRAGDALWLTVDPPAIAAAHDSLLFQLVDLDTRRTGDYDRLPQSESSFVFDGLDSFRKYRFKARVCIKDFCGDDLEFEEATNYGAPGVVGDVKLSSNVTTIRVVWQYPVEPRGPIGGYLVTIQNEETKEWKNVTVHATLAEIPVDTEFCWYSVRVTAFNFDIESDDHKQLMGVASPASRVRTRGNRAPPPTKVQPHRMKSAVRLDLDWTLEQDAEFPVAWYRLAVTKVNDKDNSSHAGPTTNSDVTDVGVTESHEFYVNEKFVSDVTDVGVTESHEFYVNEKLVSDVTDAGVTESYAFYVNDTHVSLKKLVPFSAYLISVASCTERSEDACGRPQIIETQTPVDSPGRPRMLTVVERRPSEVAIAWQPPLELNGPLDGYLVAIWSSGPLRWQAVKREATHYVLSGLDDGTEYVVYLRAYNLAEDGEPLYSIRTQTDVYTVAVGATALWKAIMGVFAFVAVGVLGYVGYVKRRRAEQESDMHQLVDGRRSTADTEAAVIVEEGSVLD